MAGPELVYYPVRFWGLDQLFRAKVKLNVADALALPEYPGFSGVYRILNHPISGVHLMGDVVSVCKKNKYILYEIDDGTGVIQCIYWRPVEGSEEGMVVPELGNLVSVFGKLCEFNARRQIRVSNFMMETDPNMEPLHWLEVIQLKRTVYSRVFVLPSGVESFGLGQDTVKESLRTVVFNVLLGNLKHRPPFTLTQLREDEKLKETVTREVLSCHGNSQEHLDRDQVAQELLAVIMGLVREGHVIQVTVDDKQSSREEYYEVVVEEKHLCPSILQFIREKSPRTEQPPSVLPSHPLPQAPAVEPPSTVTIFPPSWYPSPWLQNEVHGVSESWIVEFVTQSHKDISTAKVLTAIDLLVETSDIYPVGPKLYKTVI